MLMPCFTHKKKKAYALHKLRNLLKNKGRREEPTTLPIASSQSSTEKHWQNSTGSEMNALTKTNVFLRFNFNRATPLLRAHAPKDGLYSSTVSSWRSGPTKIILLTPTTPLNHCFLISYYYKPHFFFKTPNQGPWECSIIESNSSSTGCLKIRAWFDLSLLILTCSRHASPFPFILAPHRFFLDFYGFRYMNYSKKCVFSPYTLL